MRNFSLTLLYSEGNDIHQSTEKENVCSGRSFQCDYPTECVEEYKCETMGRRWLGFNNRDTEKGLSCKVKWYIRLELSQ